MGTLPQRRQKKRSQEEVTLAKSKTKYLATKEEIAALFEKMGIRDITEIEPLGAGEFNAAYQISTQAKKYVLKIAPPETAEVLTYEKGMMESEVFWYEQMREHTDIGIPKVYASDFSHKIVGAHCFIMEYLKGEPLWAVSCDENERERIQTEKINMLTKIHKIHEQKYGYLQSGLHDTWYEAIRAMTSALVQDCERLGRETPDGRRLIEMIDKHREILQKVPCSMVNFDLWDSNILYQNGKLYWIDPERSFWGDRIADFITLGKGQKIPLYEKQEEIEIYNRTSETPIVCGREENIRYAVAVAYLALIEEVEKYVRYEPGEPNYIRNTKDARDMYDMAWGVLS